MVSQLLDGRYQIIEVIETGEFGQTYLAKDTRRPGEPQCFVKHLRPASNDPKLIETARRLFEKEAEVLEKLGQHEQIPQLFAYFEKNQEFFLVEAFIPGYSLASEILPGKPLSEEQVVRLLKEVLEILVFVHGHGVIHRDIKPGNLIRRQSDGKLVLLDFGAVKEINLDRGQKPATVRIGTLEYMPIEQFQYNPQLNSDIYAVGMIGIQALTGLPAYELPKLRDRDNPHGGEIFWRHLAVVSQELADVLDNMVRYDFHQRYQSAAEAVADLKRVSDRSRTRVPKITIYREEVERRASHRGEISIVGRKILAELRNSLELLPEEADAIEDEVLNPYRKFKDKAQQYEQALVESMQQEYPFAKDTRDELKRLQQILGLTDQDIELIESRVLPKSLLVKLQNLILSFTQPKQSSDQPPGRFYPPGSRIADNGLPQAISNGQVSPINRNLTVIPQPQNRRINPYLIGASIAAILAVVAAIYGYLQWQKLQQRRQQESQQLNTINALYKESNYQECINQGEKVNNSSSRYADAQLLVKQCQDGTNWKNVTVKNFAEHSNAVGAVAFSPDGLTIASGSKDKTIKIWDLATGNLIRSFDGDSSAIWSVAFNSNGTRLAAGTSYWRILLWNLKTGELVRTVDHDAAVWSVAIAPDGLTLASGSSDKTSKTWNVATGDLIYNLPDHSDYVYSVAISPDGKTLVSGSKDKTITIVDVETGRLINTIDGHSDQVRSVAISPDGKTLVSGSYDRTIKIWNLATGELIRTLNGHSGEIVSVAISPDGKTIASGSKDKTIKIWDLRSGVLLNSLTGHSNEVYTVAFSPDGKTIASGGKDNTIKLWRQ
ncbi:MULTISPECIES: serine/threonine-protein kinase [Kamptonema]|uniref:serine/threonine-protein kinase n=1 Tax=Kamptonema TaxID=1501433 RepID=UPI0002EF464A|nr:MULTISPECIES: serine/threonine-protein kinase [Kamptonema]